MSEIKGQLFGVLLVIAIFSAISGVLITAFSTAANQAASEITAPVELG